MRLAIMGIRGVPAEYGGFETFARELGRRLVQRGHDVTVYGRSAYVDHRLKTFEGMKLVVLPSVRHKYLDTIVHTGLSVLHNLKEPRYDAILICNSANAIFSWVPRIRGQRVALNVDGMEWRRKKWNALGRAWYRMGAYLSTKLPDVVVTDAEVIRDFYREKFSTESVMIPYGATTGRDGSFGPVAALGLESERYFLYVSRLEPENNAHLVVRAFRGLQRDVRLALIGDAPYSQGYIEGVRKEAIEDERILMPGGIYGEGYRALQSHALAYIHATEVGGTHPALVEAMAAGNCVLAFATPENREVLGNTGLVWRTPDDLREAMQKVCAEPTWARSMGERAMKRAAERYSWDTITDRYEDLFRGMVDKR